jgi:5'-3' exonuclease
MLEVYDVSTFLYSGMGTSFGEKAKYKGIPTGGIYNLMRTLCYALKYDSVPVLVFDSWTNAKSTLPEYKGGRSNRPDIRFQADLLYDHLKDVVPNCFKIPGYEADWIASAVFDYGRDVEKQYVDGFTTDLDWAHNITSEYTSLYPANKNGKEITVRNFDKVCSTPYTYVPLNTISFYKVLFGDKSDNISKLYENGTYSLNDLFKIYTQYCKKNNLDNRLKETALEVADFFKPALGDTIYGEMLKRIEVIYPRKLETPITISKEPINKNALKKLLSLTGCKSLCTKLGIDFIEDMGELQTEVKEKYLKEIGQVSETRLFSESSVPNIEIRDRGGFD